MAQYVFPLPGWQGSIDLHHGSEKGAADLMANRGQAVVSVTSGVVESAGSSPVGGNNVLIRGDDNREYYYAHLDQTPLVHSGDRVNAGSRLGAVGNTGNAESTPPHLHIGIGDTIQSGIGPSGGAGTNFDAVGFLRALYTGSASTWNEGETSGLDPFGGITDPVTKGIASILAAFFSVFTQLWRGKK